MRKLIITIILAVLATSARANWDSWSESDRRWFVASQIAITADWMTSRYGAKYRGELEPGLRETNVFLGPYPSVGRVNIYYAILLASNYYIADAVPAHDRGLYLAIRTVAHGGAAYHNVQVGWQLRF